MRIGIEVFGTQSDSRHRGVGRYVHEFVSQLLATPSHHEFVIYGEAKGPTDYLPRLSGTSVLKLVEPDPARSERDMTAAFRRLLGANPDRLDLILITNPLELREDCLTPARPLSGMKIAAVMHDVIPLIFSDHYYTAWPGQEFVRRYQRGLDQVCTYDLILANSEATRRDVIDHLGIAPQKVVSVLAASDAPCWNPGPPTPTEAEQAALASLGITGPFIYSMGAMEYRKNIWGLLDAFALLPRSMRDTHQLVVTYNMNQDEAKSVIAYATKLQILDRMIITPRVDDETLATLYRRCVCFVFPSRYEGFGLPVLEALHCGAAVITGRNSSLVEVVGDAGLLIDINSEQAIAASLNDLLTDHQRTSRLRQAAPIQGNRFRWKDVAERTLEALPLLESPRTAYRVDTPRRSNRGKPRIAYFSPMAPLLSGISDYSQSLLEELAHDFTIDVYHDAGYEPRIKRLALEWGCYDHRLFSRNDAIRPYEGLIYQVGNSPFHKYIYDRISIDPGIVTLHDFNLSSFRFWDAVNHGGGPQAFVAEAHEYDPKLGELVAQQIDKLSRTPNAVSQFCSQHGINVNQRVFRDALAIVVHSAWAARQGKAVHGPLADKTHIIPHGANPRRRSPEERAAIRDRLGLPRDAFIMGNFGLVHPTKMNVESLHAFAAVARERADALFLMIGPDFDDGASRKTVAELGLGDRVRFHFPKETEDFIDWVAAADLGLNLRRPPTNGETSGALLHLLRQGVATIVTDVGTFSDFPDAVVRKVRWPEQGIAGLTQTTLELARDEKRRHALGRQALEHIEREHTWAAVAARYRAVIEKHGRGENWSGRVTIYRGPHTRAVARASTHKETIR